LEAKDSTSDIPQPPEEAWLDQFIACFEGLEDPRTGNAGLPELLVIALCDRYIARLPALF
jgi:hypothetical protein